MGTVYLRGKAWWLDYVDENGDRIREPSGHPTKGSSRTYLNEILVEVERKKRGLAPSSKNPNGITLASLMKAYLDAMPTTTKERTAGTIRLHISEQPEGSLLLERVTPAVIEDLAARVESKGLAVRTANKIRTHIGAAFQRARRREEFHGDNPARMVKAKQAPDYAFDVLTRDEIVRVLAHIGSTQSRWHEQMCAVSVLGGLRRGELIALRVEDVDLTVNAFRVRRSHANNHTKTRKVRMVPITAWLRPYVVAALERAGPEGLVFPSPRTGELLHRDLKASKWIKRACKELGITKPVRFHDLRHTFSTASLESGAGIHDVSKMLGHSSVRTTETLYAHVSFGRHQAEAAKLVSPEHDDDDMKRAKGGRR